MSLCFFHHWLQVQAAHVVQHFVTNTLNLPFNPVRHFFFLRLFWFTAEKISRARDFFSLPLSRYRGFEMSDISGNEKTVRVPGTEWRTNSLTVATFSGC